MNAVNKVGIGVIIMPVCLIVKSDDSFFGMILSRIYGFGMIDVTFEERKTLFAKLYF